VAVGLERAHAQLVGQGEGLLVVGFGLCDSGGSGVGLDDAKLVQRERLVPTFLELPGQVKRLTRLLPGLLAASRQTTHLAEPRNRVGLRRARADTFADRLFQQHTPLRKAPLERIGIAQACHDPSQNSPFVGGTTEGQALLQHPDGGLQVALGEVQVAEAVVDKDRSVPSACQCDEAERLLPVARPSAKAPSSLKVRASHPREVIRKPVLSPSDSRSAASTFHRCSSAARPKSPKK
jgi:hypothetical protein